MKSNIKIIGGIILTAIYCIAVSSSITNLPVNYGSKDHQTTEQGKYFSSVPSSLFGHIPQQESLSNSTDSFPTSSFKDSFNSLCGINKETERLFKAEIKQYTDFSKKFLIHYRKTDIIFPFHYFW